MGALVVEKKSDIEIWRWRTEVFFGIATIKVKTQYREILRWA